MGRARAPLTRPPPRFEPGSIEHYADPDYYTATYARRRDDVAFYVRLAERFGGPILEYGAGNGRISIPLARTGASVTGIDHSRAMARDFERKREAEPAPVRKRLAIVTGDMREVRLAKKYRLVLSTFNTALHLYARSDVEAFFQGVHHHLARGGRFVVDLSVPVAADLARDPNRSQGVPPFRYPGIGVVGYREIFDYDPISQILDVTMSFHPRTRKSSRRKSDEAKLVPRPSSFSTRLSHRQFFPREWEALLHYNGFEVDAVYGSYEEGPLDRESDVMIWVAKRRKAAR